MNHYAATVELWKELNSHRFVECRWGCSLTPEACRSYQSRTARYVIHFNGQREPYPRVNADYVKCCLPEPCPHLMPDDEVRSLRSLGDTARIRQLFERRALSREARQLDRLANPEQMLCEEQWNRSLVVR
jgi:hypothetical protein